MRGEGGGRGLDVQTREKKKSHESEIARSEEASLGMLCPEVIYLHNKGEYSCLPMKGLCWICTVTPRVLFYIK